MRADWTGVPGSPHRVSADTKLRGRFTPSSLTKIPPWALISSIAISTASLPDLHKGWKKDVGIPKTMGLAAAETIDGKEIIKKLTTNTIANQFILFFISPPPLKNFEHELFFQLFSPTHPPPFLKI
jgi:hypothetical protein